MGYQYDYWIFQQEEPQLAEMRSGGFSKKTTPTWILKIRDQQQLIEQIGEDEYNKMQKLFQERQERRRKYLNNEES